MVKEPGERLPDLGVARLEIKDAEKDLVAGHDEDRRAHIGISGRQTLSVAAMAAVLAGLVVGFVVWSQMQPEPRPSPVTHFSVVLPPDQQLTDPALRQVALSPDGTNLVYVANNQLYLRPMDQDAATPVRGTDGAMSPFFSPDGTWVAFVQNRALRKVGVTGGPVLTLTETDDFNGASWTADDTIIFASRRGGILRVSADGGATELLVPIDSDERVRQPQLLPDGETVLFTLASGGATFQQAQIVAQSLTTGDRHILVEAGSDGRYLPTGHLVFVRGFPLLAVPFDPVRLTVLGGAVPLVEGLGGYRRDDEDRCGTVQRL